VTAAKEKAVLRGHTGWVWSVALSNDGKLLANGGGEPTVRVWDVAAAKERTTLGGHTGYVYGVAFSRDGALLASGCSDGTVRLWDVAAVLKAGK
jgi:WD40 repeat protein